MIKMLRKLSHKISKFFQKNYDLLKNLPLVKSLLAVFAVLMGYKLFKFLFYFNKVIFYFLGLIFVGINWNDIYIINEARLIYDNCKLWILSWFNPNKPIIKSSIKSTVKDIEKILSEEHVTKNKPFNKPDWSTYPSEAGTNQSNSFRRTYIISDGGNNSWSWNEIISNPWIWFVVLSAITLTGVIVIKKYEITMDDVKTCTEITYNYLKSGAVATITFIYKVIKWFNRGGPGNPPMSPSGRIPNHPPIEVINPDLTPKAGPSNLNDCSIPNREEFGPSGMLSTYFDSGTETPTNNKGKVKEISLDLNSLMSKSKTYEDNVDVNHPAFDEIDVAYSIPIKTIRARIEELSQKTDATKSNIDILGRINEEFLKLFSIYEKYPQIKPLDGLFVESTKSPLDTSTIELPDFND